ncbi:MAG: hypothetical protein Ct9H90mP27_1560 [Gammaproteobacteria bacterium]|nr:MAG: hypothetical protein Ct9H90mP27_1560 [Gammaproteobacteria bacterium]
MKKVLGISQQKPFETGEFFYAEHYHQQYLAKVPNGYWGLGGTGIGCNVESLAELELA